MRSGECVTGSEEDCLVAGTSGPGNALEHHSTNQQIFAWICSMTVGATELDPAACGNSVFNSQTVIVGNLTIGSIIANLLVGNPGAAALIGQGQLGLPGPLPLVQLYTDPCDGLLSDCTTPGPPPNPVLALSGVTMNTAFTVQQQALYGCGEFYGTNCEFDGFDLLNSEASALLQSWPGFEGTSGDWDLTDPDVAQPGTLGFDGGPVCTRSEGGKRFILPGCRGPGDPGYDPNVDGTNTDLFHPLIPSFQLFRSEMAALSFNAVMGLVALSTPDASDGDPTPTLSEFDAANPMRRDGCSFVVPHLCGNVSAFDTITGVQRNNVRAAGKEENRLLTPPMRLSLEAALAYVAEDELVEVTPKSIRLRKSILDPHLRKRAERAGAA